MRLELRNGASLIARLLAMLGFIVFVIGVTIGVTAFAVIGVVAGTVLLLVPRRVVPTTVKIECQSRRGDIVEQDPTIVTVTIELDGVVESLSLVITGNSDVTVVDGTSRVRRDRTLSVSFTMTANRWGISTPPTVSVRAFSRAWLREHRCDVRLPMDIVALPQPAVVLPIPPAVVRRARIGNHVSRTAGSGVEFHGIRPFVPGDQPRQIHWPTSSRRGELYVTERSAESAMDVVAVIDAFAESGSPGDSTLDRSVRGAAGTAREFLRQSDRTGLAMLGGVLGWVPPATSRSQWYRIVTEALSVTIQASFVTPDVGRIPPVALPAGALVIVFTPLLDVRTLRVIADVRRRRFDVIVVDVMAEAEQAEGADPSAALARRLWRLRRRATKAQLEAMGCIVTSWDGSRPLALPARELAVSSLSR